MKKLFAGLLALLLLPALFGCSAMLEREYASETPHAEQEPPAEANFTIEADTYDKLVISILYFVNRHLENGTIRFSNFDGDIDEAVQTACLEVTRNDPIGAFVVDYITSDVVRIVSYYEADLTIAYKHTQDDVKNMVSAPGNITMKREIGDTLERFSTRVVFYNTSFSGDETSVRELVREAYYENPAAAMGFPEISVKLYPEEGTIRVIEIALKYPLLENEFTIRRNAVLDASLRVTESVADQSDPEKANRFCSFLHELAVLENTADGTKQPNTPWDVLIDGRGNSEGFTLAYKLLCDQAKIECRVVWGALNGMPHSWTMVTFADKSYHIDAFSENPAAYFCSDSAFLKLGYNWNTEEYPVCAESLT